MIDIVKKHYPKVIAFVAGVLFEVLTDLANYVKTALESLAK